MMMTLLKTMIITLLKILFFQAPQAFSHDAALAAHAEAERQVFDLFHRVSNTKSIFYSNLQLFCLQFSFQVAALALLHPANPGVVGDTGSVRFFCILSSLSSLA